MFMKYARNILPISLPGFFVSFPIIFFAFPQESLLNVFLFSFFGFSFSVVFLYLSHRFLYKGRYLQ